MASTYTTNLGIEKPTVGEQDGAWGTTVNLNYDMFDQAIDGIISVTLGIIGTSGAPNTLAITDGEVSDGRNKHITLIDGGDLGGTAFVQLTPNDAERIIYITNSLSGSQSVNIFQGTYNASNDFTLANGKTALLKFDGAGAGAVVTEIITVTSFEIGALTPTDSNIIVGDGTSWVAESGATARTSLGLGTGDSPTFTDATLSNDLNFSGADPNILGGDTDGLLTISANTASLGANIRLWGDTHTVANDFALRADTTNIIHYDDSISRITLTGTVVASSSFNCGAFTSTGIDDNATGERLQLSDTAMQLGDGSTSGEVFTLFMQTVTDGQLGVTGGSSSVLGGGIRLWGETHATNPSGIGFYDDNTLVGEYSTASGWDFQSTDITTTGALTAGGTVTVGAAAQHLYLHAIDTQYTSFSGGNAYDSGSTMRLYGGTHGFAAGNIQFLDAGATELEYDKSDSEWDFQANTVKTSNNFEVTDGSTANVKVNLQAGSGALELHGTAPLIDYGIFGDDYIWRTKMDSATSFTLLAEAGVATQLAYNGTTNTFDFAANAITTTGTLNCGALTSTGLNDDCTGERVQATDTLTQFGDAGTAGSTYTLSQQLDTSVLRLAGGNLAGAGGEVVAYGGTHGSKADTLELRTGDTVALTIDSSQDATFAGSVLVGTNDTVSGVISAYGHTTGSGEGGQLNLYMAADYDTTYSHVVLDVNNDDFRIITNTGKLGLQFQPAQSIVDFGTNDLVLGTGKGIDFSATADGTTMSSELFDDYEEGTFTPILSDGTNTDGTASVAVGRYTKIGRICHYAIAITMSDLGTISGSLYINGLPFTSATTSAQSAGSVSNASNMALPVAGQVVTCRVDATQARVTLHLWDATAGVTALLHSELTASGALVLSGAYEAA